MDSREEHFIGSADCNHYNCNHTFSSESSKLQSTIVQMLRQCGATVEVVTVCRSYEHYVRPGFSGAPTVPPKTRARQIHAYTYIYIYIIHIYITTKLVYIYIYIYVSVCSAILMFPGLRVLSALLGVQGLQ